MFYGNFIFSSPVIGTFDCTDKRILRRVALVDQYDGREFNINEAGFPRNDISSLARAQSKSEFDAILARLNVTDSSQSLPKDLSDKDALRLIKSKYTQSPNELEQYAQLVAQYDAEKIDEAYRKSLSSVPDDEKPAVNESKPE